MHKVVTNPRIISGIISEIGATGSLVTITSIIDTEAVTHQATLNLKWEKKFNETTFTLDGLKNISKLELKLECIVGGVRVSFQSTCLENDLFELPKEVAISDFRDAKRINLNGSIFPAEIRYPGGVILGFAHDISRDHIAITTDADCDKLDYGLKCEVLIRSINGGTDIFYREMKLFNIIDRAKGKKIIFSGIVGEINTEITRANRLIVNPVTLDFVGPTIDGRSIKGRVEITNVSVTGFSGAKIVEDYSKNLMKGIVLSSGTPKIKFYLVREKDDIVGFTIHPDFQSDWIKYIGTLNFDKTIGALEPQDLSNLFSLSAYVKDLRRGIYGKEMWAHLKNSDDYHHNLFRRVALHKEGSGLTDHVSSFRFSDNIWMIQEGIAGPEANKGDVFEIIDILVSRIKDEAIHCDFSARYAMAQFSDSIPTISKFWRKKSQWEGAEIIHALHLPNFELSQTDCDFNISLTSDLTAENRSNYSENFSPLILEIFDYWSASTSNPILNKILKTHGKGHGSKTWLVTQNGQSIAIVYSVFTHYSVNSTGMLTGLYCHINDETKASIVPELIKYLSNLAEISNGSSDFVLFQPNEKIKKDELVEGKAANDFACIVMDLKKT